MKRQQKQQQQKQQQPDIRKIRQEMMLDYYSYMG